MSATSCQRFQRVTSKVGRWPRGPHGAHDGTVMLLELADPPTAGEHGAVVGPSPRREARPPGPPESVPSGTRWHLDEYTDAGAMASSHSPSIQPKRFAGPRGGRGAGRSAESREGGAAALLIPRWKGHADPSRSVRVRRRGDSETRETHRVQGHRARGLAAARPGPRSERGGLRRQGSDAPKILHAAVRATSVRQPVIPGPSAEPRAHARVAGAWFRLCPP